MDDWVCGPVMRQWPTDAAECGDAAVELDRADQPVPSTERIIAALGPKMLELAGRRSLARAPTRSLPSTPPVLDPRWERDRFFARNRS